MSLNYKKIIYKDYEKNVVYVNYVLHLSWNFEYKYALKYLTSEVYKTFETASTA